MKMIIHDDESGDLQFILYLELSQIQSEYPPEIIERDKEVFPIIRA